MEGKFFVGTVLLLHSMWLLISLYFEINMLFITFKKILRPKKLQYLDLP